MKTHKAIVLGLVLGLTACGGGGAGPTAPTPTPVPTPVIPASILTLGVKNATFTVHSTDHFGGLLLKCGDFHAEWIITESAGLSAVVAHTEFFLVELDGDIAGRRVLDVSTAIAAGGQTTIITDRSGGYCGYDGRDYPATMKGIVNVVDARGNQFTLKGETGFVEK